MKAKVLSDVYDLTTREIMREVMKPSLSDLNELKLAKKGKNCLIFAISGGGECEYKTKR